MENPIRTGLTVKTFLYYWFPILIYCFLIFLQSSFPSIEDLPQQPHADKVFHFAGYALLGFLFYRALTTSRIKENRGLLMLLGSLLSALYGASDEIHQYFVPQRSAEVADMIADALGSVAGAFICSMAYRDGRDIS